MTGTHWIVLAGCLVSIGTMGAAFDNWSDVARPAFVFGTLGVIGTNIAAALSRPKP